MFNVLMVGVGGQGVVLTSDILTEAAMLAGHDAKKSEIHGMSQRGGSVSSDVRLGREVFSPMIPRGEADFVVVVAPDQVEVARPMMKPGGLLISPADLDAAGVKPHQKSVNVALLGALAAHLEIPQDHWVAAIQGLLPEKHHRLNLEAFALGRQAAGRE